VGNEGEQRNGGQRERVGVDGAERTNRPRVRGRKHTSDHAGGSHLKGRIMALQSGRH
jgi:hypothetical protein